MSIVARASRSCPTRTRRRKRPGRAFSFSVHRIRLSQDSCPGRDRNLGVESGRLRHPGCDRCRFRFRCRCHRGGVGGLAGLHLDRCHPSCPGGSPGPLPDLGLGHCPDLGSGSRCRRILCHRCRGVGRNGRCFRPGRKPEWPRPVKRRAGSWCISFSCLCFGVGLLSMEGGVSVLTTNQTSPP